MNEAVPDLDDIDMACNELAWTTGIIGGALEFGGVATHRVNLGDSASLRTMTEAMQVSVWIRKNDLTNKTVMGKQSSSDIASSYKIATRNSGQIQWSVTANATNGEALALHSNSKITAGQWTHVVVTFEAGTAMRIYLDGALDVEETSGIPSQNFLDNNNPHRVGTRGGGISGSEYFNGLIDDVRIYDRVLSAVEVEAIYNCGLQGGC